MPFPTNAGNTETRTNIASPSLNSVGVVGIVNIVRVHQEMVISLGWNIVQRRITVRIQRTPIQLSICAGSRVNMVMIGPNNVFTCACPLSLI